MRGKTNTPGILAIAQNEVEQEKKTEAVGAVKELLEDKDEALAIIRDAEEQIKSIDKEIAEKVKRYKLPR